MHGNRACATQGNQEGRHFLSIDAALP